MALALLLSHSLAALYPRKSRYRSAFIVLVAILCFATYLCVSHPSLSPSHALRHKDTPATDQIAVALESVRNSRVSGITGNTDRKLNKPSNQGQQRPLDLPQELAAVSSFLASLPQNIIPLSVNPSVAIDPQLVLDFDTRSPRAAEEIQRMVIDVWLRNPVFLYSKLYSPVSREIKAILAKMNLRPQPTIIDVDIRDDAAVLEPLISRLTSSPDLPILLIGGRPVGTIEDIRNLDKSGGLRTLISASGAVIGGSKRKKHRN